MTVNFLTLGPDDVDGWIAQGRAWTGPWLFHHIPKTAGSSMAAELAARAGPYANIVPDYSATSSRTADSMIAAIDRFFDQTEAQTEAQTGGRVRSLSGHFAGAQFDHLRARLPDGHRAFTFLRHPVARIYSEYNYCMTPSHPPWRLFAERFPTIRDFVDAPQEHDKCAFYMFGTTRIDPQAAIARMAEAYAVIGLQERYPVSFLMISAMIWGPSLPAHRERSAPEAARIDPAIAAAIIERNPVDMALFEAVAGVYNRIGPTLWDRLRPLAS